MMSDGFPHQYRFLTWFFTTISSIPESMHRRPTNCMLYVKSYLCRLSTDQSLLMSAVDCCCFCCCRRFTKPKVLTSSIDGALEPRLNWLQANLGVGKSVLRERVLTFPWMLNLSVQDKLAPTYDFLKTELLLEDVNIKKTLFRNPRMFLTPMRQTLASTVKWLCRSVGMEEEEAVKVVMRDARLLLRSTEVLDSKVW